LAFEICQARGKPLRDHAQMSGHLRAFLAMMARSGATFDGILKLFAAGATGSETFAGSDFFHE
jgi:hypothetical protein